MNNDRSIRNKILHFALICILSFVTALIIQVYTHQGNSKLKNEQNQFEKTLRIKEDKLQKILEKVINENSDTVPFIPLHAYIQPGLWEEEGLSVFYYRNDSLVYWSNNNVPADIMYDEGSFSKPFMHYGNGWFRVIKYGKENKNVVGLILIKNDYPYQNEYLLNDFHKDFKVTENTRLDTVPGTANIYTHDGTFLFSIATEKHQTNPAKTNLAVFSLLIVSFISLVILLFYLYHLFDFFLKRPMLLFLAFCLDVMLLRFILLYFEIPYFLYQTDLFGPYYYATSVFSPSLGDLIVNSIMWLTLAWIFFTKFSFSLSKFGKTVNLLLSLLLMGFTAILFYLLFSTIRRLVMDSNIELNLNNIFNIDVFSALGFLAMTTMVLAFFLVTAKISCIICDSCAKTWRYIAVSVLSSLLMIPLFSNEQNPGQGFIYALFLFSYQLSFLVFYKKPGGFRNITGALVYIVFFSLIATYVLDFYHGIKEKEKRKILAVELSTKRDPLMEYEFSRLKEQIMVDTAFNGILKARIANKQDDQPLIAYLKEHYFNNFWNKFDLLITVCQQEELLNIQPGGYLFNCFTYFDELVDSPGTEMVSPGLYFLSDEMENTNYIAEITFPDPDSVTPDTTKVFIELLYKYVIETGLGYPDLLIDKKIRLISGLADYSYAKYVDDNLIYKNGDFQYYLGFQAYKRQGGTSYCIDNEGYNHYVMNIDQASNLVISKKNLTFLDLIAPFSYLFIIFSLFLLLFMAGYMVSGGIKHIEFNFSNQLQVSIIAIIIISFFVLGIITRSNIINLYNNKNRDNLSEKTFSVLTEMEHKMGNAERLSEDLQPYISEILYKFSLIFYSDINLFDTRGTLIASSRPQVFSEDLLSEKMNSDAYFKLTVERSLLYLQNEKIGKQEYLSAYIPFRNNEDQIIAYLNLPYFAKQTELRKEIGDFLAAYINVYVLLIVLAIMVTILVSRFITRPLQLIREKLRNIGLGKSNEKIIWKRKDEIGNLVVEYNRMIDELASSAELLARSERESAWREMARQVAHEIKNPLTPMKLSVQYLQKAWYEKSPDWENRLARFTRTIVEQIDSLSEIASAFSDFAKMPVASIEKIELTGIIKSAADLYQHHRHIRISFDHADQEYYVSADKRQLLRVFNNLIQNAVQAIGKKEDGLIKITVSSENACYKIRISDNGSGITGEQAEKIFSPSFTTKSSGMGLGLAMVKSILTTINGTVTFESMPGEGATFTIMIPVCTE